jgi:hypothetical protein
MQMEIRGEYTKDDFKVLAALALRPTQKLYYPGLVIAPFAVGLIYWLKGELVLQVLLLILPIQAFLMVLVLWLFPYLYLRRLCRESNLVGNHFCIFVCNDTFAIETATSQTEVKWDIFSRFREEKQTFVLELLKAPGQIIPKRWLTAKEIEQLRDFLPTVLPNLDE